MSFVKPDFWNNLPFMLSLCYVSEVCADKSKFNLKWVCGNSQRLWSFARLDRQNSVVVSLVASVALNRLNLVKSRWDHSLLLCSAVSWCTEPLLVFRYSLLRVGVEIGEALLHWNSSNLRTGFVNKMCTLINWIFNSQLLKLLSYYLLSNLGKVTT